MVFDFIGSTLIYLAISLGLAWPFAMRLPLDPLEKIVATIALSLLAAFVAAWAVYVTSAPTALLWAIPVIAAANLTIDRRRLAQMFRNADARGLMIAQVLVTGWCIGLLALIVDYSGGKGVGDWFGHWQRACFFLYHWPQDLRFNGFDVLASRPPLANIVTGAFLRVTHVDFAHYQLASTVLSSLAFTPAALLARRFQPTQAPDQRPTNSHNPTSIVAALFMLSPLFAQNATYAWTKLPAAFFTLTALYFFLRSRDRDGPSCAAWILGATLGAALITHYSAGPYAVVLVLAWVVAPHQRMMSTGWWRATVAAAVSGTAVLATWFGWAMAMYGARGTFLSNTSVTDQAPTVSGQLATVVLNLRDTVLPPFLRPSIMAEFTQSSPWGWWRDKFFLSYQDNLLFAFGSVGGVVIAVVLWKMGRNAWSSTATFWSGFIGGVAILGIAVHGGRETAGLANICLQPLVLLGLAFLGGRWMALSLPWRRALVAGSAVDFSLGIVLQFGTENHAFDRWFTPGRNRAEILSSYSRFAQINSRVKGDAGWIFLGDNSAGASLMVTALLAALLLLALLRTRRITEGSR